MCDYCDGKEIADVEKTFTEYYKAISLIMLAVWSDEIGFDRPIGWENLFVIKKEKIYLIIGEFNSTFNTLWLGDRRVGEAAIFADEKVVNLEDGVFFNTAKANFVTQMITRVYNNSGTKKKFDFREFKTMIDKIISDNVPDTKSVITKVDFEIEEPVLG